MANKADIYQPIEAVRIGPPPVVLRVTVTTSQDNFAGGVPATHQRSEQYVLFSALPEELRQRVALAVQAVVAGR